MNIPHNARIIMLIVIFFSTVESSSPKTDETILKNAATQLDRLALFRKTVELDKSTEDGKSSSQKLDSNGLDESKNNGSAVNDFTIPLEVLQYLRKQLSSEAIAKSDAQSKKRIDELLADPNYNAIMVERIKRGHSGSFLSGIASKLVGGIASASSSSSSSSSSSPHGHYGHNYAAQHFDIWDFKKAVLNTLLQAVKAISGSVIALKGQIVKGGGFLISTKGKILSSAGEAISSLGRNIASSAVVAAPKPPPYPYLPEHHHSPYDSPPHSDEFSSDLSAPSADFGGQNSADDSSEEHDGVKIGTGTDIKELDVNSPNLAALEESFGSLPNGQKGSSLSLANLLSTSIEPPRQEMLHSLDTFANNNNNNPKPLEYHQQLNYGHPYDPAYGGLQNSRDPATNLVNHILQETNLNYQNLNGLKYRPGDYLQGSPTFASYGKMQPNYQNGFQKPLQESNLQPPQLPLLPHLNPDDLHKLQLDKVKGYQSSGVPAPQEPLKIPLYQLDQGQASSWPNPKYPFRDHRPHVQGTPAFDIQASVDITPGDFRDGKFRL